MIERWRSFPLRPAEGWPTPVLVVVIVLVLGWALDDPSWVNGRGKLTDPLAWCALLGATVGFVGAKAGWGRWTTHLVGAVFAALAIGILAGWAVAPGTSAGEAFRIAAAGSVAAYLDLAWYGRQVTSQEVHFVGTLCLIVWGTAQFTSYAVFGHRQPLNAVVVAGLVLLANIALTSRDQLAYLVVFTGAALFLLIEMHAFEERATWLRRRIGDPSAIAGLYLRGGTVFIALAVVGSLVLTQRAASAPLAGAWKGIDRQLIELSEEFSRYLPMGGDLRAIGGVTFGSAARIPDRWYSDQGVAFRASVPLDAPELYWRAATYDAFVLQAWEQTGVTDVAVGRGEQLLAGTPEDPVPELTDPLRVKIWPDGFRDDSLLSPGTPATVNANATVQLVEASGWFAGVELPDDPPEYTVDARLLQLADETVISANRLRAAPEDYPDDLVARYTDVPEGSLGPDAVDVLDTVLANAPSTDPYDLAVFIRDYLRDPANFDYTTDVRDWPCDSPSAVECFARTKHGYCLHYASTMAILLRAANPDNPIPTRLVQGFLPGQRSGTSETVQNDKAHAWVEVYFPGYGWIPFDPTGGDVGRPPVIQEGPAVPSASPGASASFGPRPSLPGRRGELEEDPGAVGAGGSRGEGPPDAALFAVLGVVTVLIVLAAIAAVWLRGPRGVVNPETAWAATSRVAGRLGFRQRPTQTYYEYAAALGELVPVAGPDLHTVAEAKVETAYARIPLADDRLRAVREATRRLRVSLLRLVLHRGRRWRRSGR
jgi:transglutaminase-like putative cysteine protease